MMMEKMIDNYKQFMEIDTFPEFEIQYYALDCSKDYSYGAQAVFDVKTKKHTLRLPTNFEVPRFLLFHELTHILDAEKYSIGEKNHDFCLHGFTEYHASQVELMVMIGAETISSAVCFSMKEQINRSDWSVQKYIDNKLETARKLMQYSERRRRIDGLGALYNFFGLRSICSLYSSDFIDQYDYHDFLETMSSYLFMSLKSYMIGWVNDVEKAVALYSNVLNAVLS